MKIKQEATALAIDSAARLLMDDQLWVDARLFVKRINDEDISNEEKHAIVKDELILIFGRIGETLLDIAIKIAVLWLKNESVK